MIEVQKNVLLSEKTFYGIGGPADELYEIDSPDGFGEIWDETIHQNIPKIILGKGANIVFSDKGFRGRVFIPKFDKITWVDKENGIVTVDTGCEFQKFIEETNKAGFEDLCNLSGIPGNTGGFIRGNAGAYCMETGDEIIAVEALDSSGRPQKMAHKNCHFEYRGSVFKKKPDLFILRATFQLTQKTDPEDALHQTKTLQKNRWQKYPAGRSGGCVFKNPDPENGLLAGKLLDELGAKGDCIGGIEIPQEHANFFINKGNGKQKDILDLIEKWTKIVWEKRAAKLEPEIYIIDEYGKKIV